MLTINSPIFIPAVCQLVLSLVYHPLECSPLASERSLILLLDLTEGDIGLLFYQLHRVLYGDVVWSSAPTNGWPDGGFFDGA